MTSDCEGNGTEQGSLHLHLHAWGRVIQSRDVWLQTQRQHTSERYRPGYRDKSHRCTDIMEGTDANRQSLPGPVEKQVCPQTCGRSHKWILGCAPPHKGARGNMTGRWVDQRCGHLPESTRPLRGPNHCWSTLYLRGLSTATVCCFLEPPSPAPRTHMWRLGSPDTQVRVLTGLGPTHGG